MHVWKPVNKVWALAAENDDRVASSSLKRAGGRLEQISVRKKGDAHERSRALRAQSCDAVAKRQRTSETPLDAAEDSSVPSPRAPAPSVADAAPAPASNQPPVLSDATSSDAGHADGRVAARVALPESDTAAADNGAERARPLPPASGAAQALRIAIAAGERESERYTGFELVEEVTEEQLAEAADELYEPLPTCPICAHSSQLHHMQVASSGSKTEITFAPTIQTICGSVPNCE